MSINSQVKRLASASEVRDLGITPEDVTLWINSATGDMSYRYESAPGVFTDMPVTAAGGFSFQGALSPGGGNIDYPAAQVGDVWLFDSDGTIGAPPIAVDEGDMLICTADSAGGAGAAADFSIQAFNVFQASETQEGILRFCTLAELITGTAANTGISPLNFTDILTVTGMSVPIKAFAFQPQAEGDSVNLQSPDRTVAGTAGGAANLIPGNGGDQAGGVAGNGGSMGGSMGGEGGMGGEGTGASATGGDGGSAGFNGGEGGDANGAAGNGGDGGEAGFLAGDGGDATGAGGTPGDGGRGRLEGGDGGDSSGGAGSVGGAGGDIDITPGTGGTGETPGADGTINLNGLVKTSFSPNVIAFAGGGQGSATVLTGKHNRLTTVASNGDSVLMPEAIAGVQVIVNNSSGGGNSADVYPRSGQNFAGLAADVATPLADTAFITLFCYVAGQWDFE